MTTLQDIVAAHDRIRPLVHRTPVATCGALDALAGRRLVFKCENFQKVGAFKFRGACNAVFRLSEEAARRGVVTHSSGNHAQALALAARLRGVPATIVMPENSPRVKVDAVRGYGAAIVFCAPTQQARERAASELVAASGATLIPPYDHADVIAGQGTLALELFEQRPDLAGVIVPVGGGGLIAGVAIAAKGLRPGVRIIGAEPAEADDAYRGKLSGRRQPALATATIADGLRTALGDLTWPVVRDCVDEIVTVSETAIRKAMRLVFERLKLVIEPSAGVGVAAALDERIRCLPGLDPLGVVLCGGNVDLDGLFGERDEQPVTRIAPT
ncbi:MAG TPA: pyridoxal-phosphate dependent enzyme [Phycisphaerales bacterium]|nr:pyridoxal-phosphate dependent enzyme [Phycisphaerales bacterium]HMP38545.1 pyridoxal-phosphate dependent enzyme [Phycisphaerales bacterium]